MSREPWNRGPRRWTNQRAFFGGNGATRGSARSPPAEEGRRVPPNAGEPFTRARRLARRATSAPASHARCKDFGDDVRGGHPGISRRERARASRGVSSGDTSRPGFARLRMCDSHRSSIRAGVAPGRVSVPRAPRTGRVRQCDAGRRRRLFRRARGRFHPGASHARAHAFGSSEARPRVSTFPADLTDASLALSLPRSTCRVRSASSSTKTPSKSTPP